MVPVNESLTSVQLPSNSIAESAGIPVWVFIVILVAIVRFIIYKEATKPKITIPSLPPKRTRLAHVLFEKRWHPFVTALLIGLIAIAA